MIFGFGDFSQSPGSGPCAATISRESLASGPIAIGYGISVVASAAAITVPLTDKSWLQTA